MVHEPPREFWFLVDQDSEQMVDEDGDLVITDTADEAFAIAAHHFDAFDKVWYVYKATLEEPPAT